MPDATHTTDLELEEQVRRLTEESELLVESRRRGAGAGPRAPAGGACSSSSSMVLATILAPAATVAGWARVQLTSADAFVDTFAPLADDPSVQAMVTDQAVTAINSAVDIPGLTNEVFTGIDQIGLPPRAGGTEAAAPATQGIQSFIESPSRTWCVDRLPRPDAAGAGTAHDSLVALQGDLSDPDRAVTVSSTGRSASS